MGSKSGGAAVAGARAGAVARAGKHMAVVAAVAVAVSTRGMKLADESHRQVCCSMHIHTHRK